MNLSARRPYYREVQRTLEKGSRVVTEEKSATEEGRSNENAGVSAKVGGENRQ